MKFLPSTTQERFRLLALPFRVYVFGVAIFYPFWRLLMSGSPGIIGGGDLTEGLMRLSIGYFISSMALLVICIIQLLIKDFKNSKWNVVFAIVALICGWGLFPPYMR